MCTVYTSLHGQHIGEAKEHAQSEYSQLKYINGYDDPEIIAGAGTMAIEILERVPDCDVVLIPVGGAGLIAGMSLVFKTLRPEVQVIGVEPENVASFAAALKAGYPVHTFRDPTLVMHIVHITSLTMKYVTCYNLYSMSGGWFGSAHSRTNILQCSPQICRFNLHRI